MKKSILSLFSSLGIFFAGISYAQDSSSSTAQNTPIERTAPLSQDNFYYNLFRDISREDFNKPEKLPEKINLERALEAIEAYEGEKVDKSYYKNKEFMEIYADAVKAEMKNNPPTPLNVPYNYEPGDFVYMEYVWNPLGVAARRKYHIVRKIGNYIQDVQNSTTLKYNNPNSDFYFHLGPSINQWKKEEIRLRGKLGLLPGNKLSWKVGLEDLAVALDLDCLRFGKWQFYFEHGHDFNTNEKNYMIKLRKD